MLQCVGWDDCIAPGGLRAVEEPASTRGPGRCSTSRAPISTSSRTSGRSPTRAGRDSACAAMESGTSENRTHSCSATATTPTTADPWIAGHGSLGHRPHRAGGRHRRDQRAGEPADPSAPRPVGSAGIAQRERRRRGDAGQRSPTSERRCSSGVPAAVSPSEPEPPPLTGTGTSPDPRPKLLSTDATTAAFLTCHPRQQPSHDREGCGQ